ncbi:MAG TPA: AI-2E family transporter [Gemmatimonadaceae bacterium]|jgi:predicted PurR-regulated permease PerM|nr:AI-2E family transporter [Gemmatimonadaceae bacterium]
MKVSAQEKESQPVVRFEITPRSCALILATVAGVWLAYQLRLVALILLMALILAGTFNPMVEWMEARGIKRVPALILLLLALTACAALLLFLTFPPMIDQITEMVRTAPDTRTRLIALLNEHAMTVPLAHVLESAGLEETFARIKSALLGYTSMAARVAGYGATTLALSFYLLADGKRAQGVAYAIVPRDYHMRLARILQNMETIVGGYMRGQLITSTSIGVFTFVLLTICKVPNALAFALFASVIDVLPFIGGLMVIPPAVIAAVPGGLPVMGVVFVSFCVYTEFESRILVPKVYGQVLRLSPTVVILALVAGGSLAGVVGALLALPIAAGLLMILEELRVEMPGDDSVDRAERARHAKTEATYEQMSAGATAPEAGQIAKHLAHELRDADLTTTAGRGAGAAE